MAVLALVLVGAAAAHEGHNDHVHRDGTFLPGPDHVLVLLALGLGLGRLESDGKAAPVATVVVAATFGILLGLALSVNVPALFRAIPLMLGGLLLLDPWGRIKAIASPSTGLVALAVGLAYGAQIPSAGGIPIYVGFAAAASVILTATGLLAWRRWNQPWCRIGMRIAGSWLVAIGIILLGAAFRPV